MSLFRKLKRPLLLLLAAVMIGNSLPLSVLAEGTAAQQDDQCVEHGDTPPCRSLYGSLTVSISYKQQHFHCSAYRDSWKRKNQRRSREDIEIQQDDINVK